MRRKNGFDLRSEARFGRILVKQGFVSARLVEQELEALLFMARMRSTILPTLAEVFVRKGVLNADHVELALSRLRLATAG